MENSSKNWNLLPYQLPCYNDWSINKDSVSNNGVVGLDILGDIDPNIFKQAIELFVKEHYILSNFKFSKINNIVKQEYNGVDSFHFEMATVETEEELESLTTKIANIPIDISSPPLVKNFLIQKRGTKRYRYVLATHHIIADPNSGHIIVDVISQIYKGITNASELPRPTRNKAINYLDNYIEESGDKLGLDRYIRKYFVNNVNFNFGRISKSRKLSNLSFHLDKGISQSLNEFVENSDYSAFDIFSCAFSILMHLVHNTDKVLVTYPANTRSKQSREIIGPFYNLNFWGSKISETSTILDLLNFLKKQNVEAKDIANTKVIDNIQYFFRGAGASQVEVPNLSLIEIESDLKDIDMGNSIRCHKIDSNILGFYYDLALSYELGSTTNIAWSYKSDIINSSTIRTYQQYLNIILQQIIFQPQAIIKTINFATVKSKSGAALSGISLLREIKSENSCVCYTDEVKKTKVVNLFSDIKQKHLSKDLQKIDKVIYVAFAKEYHNISNYIGKVRKGAILVLLSYVDEVYRVSLPSNVNLIKLMIDYNDNHFAVMSHDRLYPTSQVSVEPSELEISSELLVDDKPTGINAVIKSDYNLYLCFGNVHLDYQELVKKALEVNDFEYIYIDIAKKIYLVGLNFGLKGKLEKIYGTDEFQYQMNQSLIDNGFRNYIPVAWVNINEAKEHHKFISSYSMDYSRQVKQNFNDKYILRLKKIWREFCPEPVKEFNMNRSYGYYGIDNRKSKNMLNRINEDLGTSYPISWLEDNNTLASQYRAVTKDRENISGLYEPISKLKDGNENFTPLVLIHPFFYHTCCYEMLVKFIDPNIPVYGVNSYNLESDEGFIDNVEDLAKLYVDYIISNIKSDKFNIGGWSYGGIVSIEVARQLTDLGYKVESVIMIDSIKGVKGIAKFIASRLRADLLKQYLPVKTVSHIESLPKNYHMHILKVMRLEFSMIGKYKFPKYYGNCLFLRAGKQSFGKMNNFFYCTKLSGFEKCLQNYKIVEIPADHNAMISFSAHITASAINAHLQSISGNASDVERNNMVFQ